MGKGIRVSIVGDNLRILERKTFRYRVTEVHPLSSLESYNLIDSKLVLIFRDGRLVLEECDNLEEIKRILDNIMYIKEEKLRIDEARREIVDKALEDFDKIVTYVRDVLPAFLELFSALSGKPDFDTAKGKAINILSLGVGEAEKIVRELEDYNVHAAYETSIKIVRKIYEDLRKQEFLGDEQLKTLSLKTLDLGVLLNKVIAEISAGKEFHRDMDRVRKLYEEIIELKPKIPEHLRVEHVYDLIEDSLRKARERYYEIAYKIADRILRERRLSTTSN